MGKQKYTSAQLADMTTHMRNRVICQVECATPEEWIKGYTWYPNTHDMLREWADETGYSFEQCVGVFAVMSANKGYRQNVVSAWNILSGQAPMFGTGSEHDKSYAILDGDMSMVRGPKVSCFDGNIRHPMSDEWVTIDTIMMGMVGMSPKELDVKGVRDALKLGIRQAAAILGLLPNQAQAIAWVVTRGNDR